MAILEAAEIGLPLLISRQCHFDMVERLGAGWVLDRTPEAFADALVRVFREQTLQRTMGESAKAMVASRYTWKSVAADALDMYAAMLRETEASDRALAAPHRAGAQP